MQAIILAGGQGQRLRPYTNDRPKGMVEVLGLPILGYQIQWLRSYGVESIVISCGYLHEVIQNYFGDGHQWGLRIEYAVEDEPLGRGGGLKYAMKHLPNRDDLVIGMNGDVITNMSLTQMAEQHRSSSAVATVLLAPFISPYGIVELEGNHIRAFREKPELPYWINGGVYVLSPEVYEWLPDKGDHEDSTFPHLAEQGKLYAFPCRSYWRGIDTVKDISEVNKELQSLLVKSFFNNANKSQ